MAKLVSGRVKRFPQTGITSNRYQFLGLEQVEPNLGDPLVGPSSVGLNAVPSGDKYILVSVPGYNGSRYWSKLQTSDIDYATSAGIATYATSAGIATNVIGGISSITNLTVSGVSTFNSNVGIGTTNALASLHVLNGAIFSGSTSSELVRITQTGTGPALVVEDSANPDSTPFAVTTDGRVAIGLGPTGISTVYKLEVDGGGNGGDVRFVSSGQGDLIISHSNLVSNIRAAGTVQLGLGANDGEAIRINLNNNVGIATTNPISKLHVVGNSYITGILTSVGGISAGTVQILSGIVTATSGVVTYYGDGSKLSGVTGTQVVTQDAVSTPVYPILASNTGVSSVGISTQQLVFVPSSGKLGIGSTNPISKLHIIGDAYVTGIITAFDFNSASDLTLKENVQTIENALNVTCQLRGVTFDWKNNHKSSIGVIAQEIEEVLPELVSQTDPKTVNYNGLIGVLIEAIKELKQEVEELKKNQN